MGTLSGAFAEEEAPNRSYLSNIFEEEPVSLETFIKDKKYMASDWMLSDVQYEAVRQIERVYLPELYPLMAEEFEGDYWKAVLPMKNLITLQWGKGSGKDHVCRVASLRVAYMLLCLRSPQKYYGMPEQDFIHLLNIAANAPQANRAFFGPLRESVKRSPWFRDRSHPLRDAIQYDKNIEAVSGHSDAEGQEGLNIMLGVADEIDAFKAKDEMVGQGKRAREASTSAESILKMLKGSASTRFPYSYKRVAISYPRYKGSTIQKLTAEADEDIKQVGNATSIYFASGPLATWDVNPRISGPEAYASDYRKNPEEAAAMYECKPTRASDAYFRNPVIFKQAVDRDEQPLSVDYKLTTIKSTTTDLTTVGWEPVFTFAPDFKPMAGARYAMHGDLAIRGDRAGIAMSHIEKYEERIDLVTLDDGFVVEVPSVVPVVRNDFTIAFEADIGETPPREIQIRWARMLAFELIKRGFRIVRFTFDGFQSADTIQILTRHGIESKRVSADINDDVYKNLKDVASEGRLKMPFEQLLLNELEALSRMNGKVDHPPGGSKDLADAFAASIMGAIESGGQEDDGTTVDAATPEFELGNQVTDLAMLTGAMNANGGLALPAMLRGMNFGG